MRMRMICVNGLAISLTKVVAGQIGMQFRPAREEQVDVWEDISCALTKSGRLLYSDRLGGSVIYIANFSSVEEAIRFLRSAEFKVAVVLQDEFTLVAMETF